MTNTKEYMLFRVFAITLATVLLAPSLVKFNHIFENHKHEVCIDYSTSHLHEIDLDCEFYKFDKVNEYHNTLDYNYESFTSIFPNTNFSYYNFLSSHQQLNFSLRGPPSLFI